MVFLAIGGVMHFYEVLELCNEKILTDEFLKLCTDSPDIQHTKEIFISFLKNLKKIEPNISDKMTIFIEQKKGFDGSFYEAVHALRENDSEKYGLEINPWADTLGYRTDKNSIGKYGAEVYTALVLWEMTWFGFDEDSIHKKVKEWNEG